MDEKLKELESKIKKLEEQVKRSEKIAEENKTIYPIYVDGKKWVSATHWY